MWRSTILQTREQEHTLTVGWRGALGGLLYSVIVAGVDQDAVYYNSVLILHYLSFFMGPLLGSE